VADETKITWADATHNEWIGCAKISPACDHCYAADMMDRRFHRVAWGGPGAGEGTRVLTSRANRQKPLTWDRAAKASGKRPLVFSLSLGDWADNAVEEDWTHALLDRVEATPHLYWLLLTKRPENVLPIMYGNKGRRRGRPRGWPRNAALGTTCEDRARLARNAPLMIGAQNLLGIPAMFVSYEPALEPIADIAREFMRPWGHMGIGWWLVGGESAQEPGHVPRESDPQWFRDVRDACAETGALFHMKQMTDHRPIPADLLIQSRPDVSRYCA
jgi:protein gp37